jgi:hypothetical protein
MCLRVSASVCLQIGSGCRESQLRHTQSISPIESERLVLLYLPRNLVAPRASANEQLGFLAPALRKSSIHGIG